MKTNYKRLTRWKVLLFGLVISSVGAAATSVLYQEYERRGKIKFGPNEGAALAFLGNLKYPIESIQELEIIDAASGTFLVRDLSDIICLGDWAKLKLTCRNKIGLTTYQGDAD